VRPQQPAAAADQQSDVPADTDTLVADLLACGRSALLLRWQVVACLDAAQVELARAALDREMAIVPDGPVTVQRPEDTAPGAAAVETVAVKAGIRVVRVGAYYLDRYAVSNRQFLAFVATGGYRQRELWDPAIWPGVAQFVDQTGLPGPRYWRDGSYAHGEDDLPVVGVSWFEAATYARWVGKRLPSDAQWIKAGAWPIALTAAACVERSYPWGDAMDCRRANLWSTGLGHVVPVTDFPEGVSLGGIHQLIGNVWEWTGSDFHPRLDPDGPVLLATPMKSLRGGAFDTYFEHQTTCQFASGDNPLARKPNIGFRCALDAVDVAPPPPDGDEGDGCAGAPPAAAVGTAAIDAAFDAAADPLAVQEAVP